MLSLGKVHEILWKIGAVNYRYKDVVMTKCRNKKTCCTTGRLRITSMPKFWTAPITAHIL
jgi:hypothetical protein